MGQASFSECEPPTSAGAELELGSRSRIWRNHPDTLRMREMDEVVYEALAGARNARQAGYSSPGTIWREASGAIYSTGVTLKEGVRCASD